MEAVHKAKERFAKYPQVFARCTKQAALYARCVLLNDNLKKDDCANEFKEFNTCLQSAAKGMKTRITFLVMMYAMTDVVKSAVNLPFGYHLAGALFIRVLLIAYASFHDAAYDVPYTDVDYKVFTDAARHVSMGKSPYQRHTYRYSPFIAYLLVPNIAFASYGKLVFSVFDMLLAIAARRLVQYQLAHKNVDKALGSRISKYCSLFWLYNPLSIAISTRGNADSVPCFVVLLSLLFLQTDIVNGLLRYALSGIFLGISIHLRLYPAAFSFPMYLSLGGYKINRSTSIRDGLVSLLPNKKQLILTSSCILTLSVLTLVMYCLYGYEFLFETYIYHLFRKDTRHNFSVLFYYLYLTMDELVFDVVKMAGLVFECVILLVISLAFGGEADTLPFAMFCQSAVLVAYNSVMTSQYFVWFLSLLPLVAHSLRVSPGAAAALITVWLGAQAAWLYFAYLLEFQCANVFFLVWVNSVVFFCSNVFVLGQIIKRYNPDFGFGLAECKKRFK